MSAAPLSTVLQVQHLGFSYPDQAPLFSDWSADIGAGLTLLQGEMSSGKTTLLRLLAGELPSTGERRLLGRRLGDDPAADRRDICWFDPRDPAYDALTATGLMEQLRERHPQLDAARWQRHVDGLLLTPHQAKPLYALSTGSRRKAALAIALSAGCPLTLLDEPAAGLDAPSARYLARALAESVRAPQRAVLLVCSFGLDDLPLTATLTLPGAAPG
jgi:ABC-2 type transport system ATP-binding protein